MNLQYRTTDCPDREGEVRTDHFRWLDPFVRVSQFGKDRRTLFENVTKFMAHVRIRFEHKSVLWIILARLLVVANHKCSILARKLVENVVKPVMLWNRCTSDRQKALQIKFASESLVHPNREQNQRSPLVILPRKNLDGEPKSFCGKENSQFLCQRRRHLLTGFCRLALLFPFCLASINFRLRNTQGALGEGFHFFKRGRLFCWMRFHAGIVPQRTGNCNESLRKVEQ